MLPKTTWWGSDFERERESASLRGAERERERIPSSLHTASAEPKVELKFPKP